MTKTDSYYDKLHEQIKAAKPKLRSLKKKLLNIGGSDMVPMPEPHIKELLNRGHQFSTQRLDLYEGMEPNRCHGNSAILWADYGNSTFAICTGWALTKHDGRWRQHSWILDRTAKSIIETTECKRQKYFGFELTPAEACLFYIMNWENMRFLHNPPVPEIKTNGLLSILNPSTK